MNSGGYFVPSSNHGGKEFSYIGIDGKTEGSSVQIDLQEDFNCPDLLKIEDQQQNPIRSSKDSAGPTINTI